MVRALRLSALLDDPASRGGARGAELWRTVRWVLLIGTIAVHCARVYVEGPVMGTDQAYQIAGARALLEGQGVRLGAFESSDMAAVSNVPLRWWPPLYSLLAAPLLAASGDPALVLAASTWAGLALIFASWFAVLEMLGALVDWRAKLLLWLYWIAVAGPIARHENTGATDHLALGLFSVGLACAMAVVTERGHAWRWSLAAGCAVGLAGALRYAYIPVAVIVPASLAVLGLLDRRRPWVSAAVGCGVAAAVIIGVGALLPLAGERASNPTAMLSSTRSVASVLSRMAPVPAMAFGLGQRWVPGDPSTVLLWAVSAAVLAALTAMVALHFRDLLGRPPAQRRPVAGLTLLYVATVIGCAVLVVTFGYLSVRQAPQADWVILQEVRYYSPVLGLLMCLTFLNAVRWWGDHRLLALGVAALVAWGALGVGKTAREMWPSGQPRSRGVTMDAKDPRWQPYFAVRALRSGGHEVAFLDSGPDNSQKAWASAAGAAIHQGIHAAPLSDAFETSRPLKVVALARRDSPEASVAALLAFVRRAKIVQTVTTELAVLYVVDASARVATK